MQSPGGRGFRHSQFEQEIDPDEIFRMFFGGGLFEQPRRRQAAQRGGRNQPRQQQDDPMAVLRQFLPLLFVVFMSLLTGLTSDASSYSHHEAQPRVRDYKFSFSQSYAYPHQLQTSNLNQLYFVNDQALYEFRRASERKLRTDDRVEDEVIRRLEKKCSESKKQR